MEENSGADGSVVRRYFETKVKNGMSLGKWKINNLISCMQSERLKKRVRRLGKYVRGIFSVYNVRKNRPVRKYKQLTFLGIRFRWKIHDLKYKKFRYWQKIIGCKNTTDRRNKIICILGFKFRKKIRGAISIGRSYKKKVGKVDAEIVHIVANNNYLSCYYNMVMKFCSGHCHFFIAYKGSETNPIKECDNVVWGNVMTAQIDLKKTKKIILHGILEKPIWEWLYKNPKYLKIAYWCIWSADLYRFPGQKNDFVRKNVKALVTIYDYEEYRRRYGDKMCFYAYYLNPLAPYLKEDMYQDTNCVRIQINQSRTSDTLKTLDMLAKFKDENIRIWTPVSYGMIGETITAKEINAYGKAIFGNKFSVQNVYLSPAEYVRLIERNNIFIHSVGRQCGAGNIAAAFYAGAKVFLHPQSTVCTAFRRSGQEFFDVNKIKDMSFEEFSRYTEEQKLENHNRIKKYFSAEYVAGFWQKIFDDER